ncbi:unnamed protein product [Trichogramma brassicae]|uniref:Ig-like domain-containing protein n=1 Tax=Trichogramma brassicae TaxID=86971 RepID=A0A6H5IK46_9HYME|nr:unnamed protein product [Trichogramma brassicae]
MDRFDTHFCRWLLIKISVQVLHSYTQNQRIYFHSPETAAAAAAREEDIPRYTVAWMLFDQSAILTVHNHVITRNPRISVSHDKHRTWYLHISNVQEEDKGRYMCQINTATAKTQYGYLHVVVPPNIDDSQSSSDVIVREGANVSLSCNASGSPTPSIRWKRDDNNKININKTLSVPPMLWIPHQLVGVPLGYSVTLECHTEAHPTSLNYWTRSDDGVMIHESRKYRKSDYDSYKCMAKNPRGETEGTIRLYGSKHLSSVKIEYRLRGRGESSGSFRKSILPFKWKRESSRSACGFVLHSPRRATN